MIELVQFKPSGDAQEAVVKILENALEQARSGTMLDVAVIAAIRDADGPQHWTSYYGESAYATISTIVAGAASLTFSLQYDRHKFDEGRGPP